MGPPKTYLLFLTSLFLLTLGHKNTNTQQVTPGHYDPDTTTHRTAPTPTLGLPMPLTVPGVADIVPEEVDGLFIIYFLLRVCTASRGMARRRGHDLNMSHAKLYPCMSASPSMPLLVLETTNAAPRGYSLANGDFPWRIRHARAISGLKIDTRSLHPWLWPGSVAVGASPELEGGGEDRNRWKEGKLSRGKRWEWWLAAARHGDTGRYTGYWIREKMIDAGRYRKIHHVEK